MILYEYYKELLSAYSGKEIPLIDNIVSGKFYTGVSLSDGSLGISYNFITGNCSNIGYLNGQNPFDIYKKVEDDVLKMIKYVMPCVAK